MGGLYAWVAMVRAEVLCQPEHDAAIDPSVPSLAGPGLIESVSDITGLAVVAAHEHKHTTFGGGGGGRKTKGIAGSSDSGRSRDWSTSLARELEAGLYKMERHLEAGAAARNARRGGQASPSGGVDDVEDSEAVRCMRQVLATDPSHVRDFLRLASWYDAMQAGFLFRPRQLSHFDWVSVEAAVTCASILEKHLPTATSNHPGQRGASVLYERRYDHSFRFGDIVTIVGAADAVTTAGDTGEIFEVKCMEQLLPEHLLQLACYTWLDAMEEVKRHVRKATAKEARGNVSGRAPTAAFRGFKGSGRDQREYTEEEGMDPLALLDSFERTGGDAAAVMKRAVLLNARTGEAVELQANLHALTQVVFTLVDQRRRSNPAVPDDEFLGACAAAGAVLHPPTEKSPLTTTFSSSSQSSSSLSSLPAVAATAQSGGTVRGISAGSGDARRGGGDDGSGGVGGGGDDGEARMEGRGVSKSPSLPRSTATSVGSSTMGAAGVGVEEDWYGGTNPNMVPIGTVPVQTGTEMVTAGGIERSADLERKVLLGGDAPRPRGRAPAARPWWDSAAAVYVAVD